MKDLTNSQLIEKAKTYDRIQNEGGEGYNPYRAELERREMEAEAARPKSFGERKAALLHKIEIKDCSIARESGTFDQAEIDIFRAEIKKIEAEEQAAFEVEWTKEVTQERREGWNSFIRSLGELDGKKMQQVYKRQGEQGWMLEDLKKAIKLNNL